MSAYRYEIKFSLDEAMFAKAMSWMLVNTSAVRKYSNRNVNSLYFDDANYSSVRDNIIGLPERIKYRVRWYSLNDSQISSYPKFELKIRSGRLGRKETFDLPNLDQRLESFSPKEIAQEVKKELLNSDFILEDYLAPSLLVNYLREYYEDNLGLRITFDKKIEFVFVDGMNSKLSDCPKTSYYRYIMEFKFSPDIKDYVSDIIRELNMTPTRHSKYLIGLAKCGNLLYV